MREFIQSKLEEIEGLEVTAENSDDILEDGKTYFSFTLYKNYRDSDLNKNYTYNQSLIGFIKRLEKPTENTLEIIDSMQDKIETKLKEINIKTSFQDVSVANGIRKTRCVGECLYNEINYEIV